MILTDGVHLVSDTSLDELHKFAQSIDLKRHWFQVHRCHPHYDIVTLKMYRKVIAKGAVEINRKDLVRRMVKK